MGPPGLLHQELPGLRREVQGGELAGPPGGGGLQVSEAGGQLGGGVRGGGETWRTWNSSSLPPRVMRRRAAWRAGPVAESEAWLEAKVAGRVDSRVSTSSRDSLRFTRRSSACQPASQSDSQLGSQYVIQEGVHKLSRVVSLQPASRSLGSQSVVSRH